MIRTLSLQNKLLSAISNKIQPLRRRASACCFRYFIVFTSAETQDLSEAVEAADEEQFLDKLQAYDSMSKLDKWKTAIFLRVKEEFDAEPDLT
jgi:hypothetical protein